MKKNMIALAVAAAFAAPVAMADAPVVYGKLNLNIADSKATGSTVNSTASRLGIKGSEDLGNGLKAVYKVEFALNDVADDSSKETVTARNQYLGLAGGFGTVLMGRHDVPVKMIQPSDLFNDGAADLGKDVMTSGITVGEERVGDVLAYVSPSFSGVKVIAAAVMGEDGVNDAAGAEDWTTIAATYGSTKKGLFLSAGTMTATTPSAADATINRFSAQYKANGLTANVIFMDADGASTTEGTVTQMNLGYKIGKFMPKIKVSMADPKATGDASSTNMAYGLNYSLGKKTTAYIYTVDADKKNTADTTDSSYIGMVHNF